MGHWSLECLEIPAGAPRKSSGKRYNRAQCGLPQTQTHFGLEETVRMPLSQGKKSQCLDRDDFQTALLGVRVGGWERGGASTSHKLSCEVSFAANKNLLIHIHNTWKPVHQLPLNNLPPLISLRSFHSKSGPQTCSSCSITWGLIRNTDLLNQSFPFNKIPKQFVSTLYFEN